MKFEIKNRFSASLLFSLETETLKLCIEAAVKQRAYLRGAYLGGADLGGAYLRGAYLGGAYLRGAYLRGAYLRGADLGGADLGGAYLRGAYLGGAYLGGAYLGGADLGGAYLGGADLGGADLGGAYLRGAYLRGAYLGGAKLEHEGTELVLIGDRPFLQIGPIGSRLDYLSAFSTDHGIYVRTGCFWNTLDAFRAAVAEEHGDSVHAIEYVAAISMIELHAKHWAPVTAASAAA